LYEVPDEVTQRVAVAEFIGIFFSNYLIFGESVFYGCDD